MSPYDDSWIISQEKLPNGATLTRLKPAPIPTDGLTVTAGGAKRLMRYGSMTLALNAEEIEMFNRGHAPRRHKKGTQRG